ncbi:hypothetical protein [Arthrobacter sp. OV608]|uniref:hypothetical protein n=1 Tax=Arthrobacter sp. OV608 TaxID=1882768 RepID=UPI00147E5F87|nr:hypothetical protein [Arthrobacter sp. OV608]
MMLIVSWVEAVILSPSKLDKLPGGVVIPSRLWASFYQRPSASVKPIMKSDARVVESNPPQAGAGYGNFWLAEGQALTRGLVEMQAAFRSVQSPEWPPDEARLRELFTGLQQHGRGLVIVDQPNTIGAFPIVWPGTVAALLPTSPTAPRRHPNHCGPGPLDMT